MWAVPKNSGPDGVLLRLHGGGLVSGSIDNWRLPDQAISEFSSRC
jgi:acetyl esterase/lipase